MKVESKRLKQSKQTQSKQPEKQDDVGAGSMRRRHFLGLTGVAAGVALLEGCSRQETRLIEQTLRRGPGHPGQATWQRSICKQCTGGCEIKVRTIDGRAKKIEGDARSAVNSGGVCALGHSALQELYHPQRWLQPTLHQEDGTWREVAWEEALHTLSARFRRAAGMPGSVALCCGSEPTERALIERLAKALGASVTVVEPPHTAVERQARRQFFGADVELLYDLSDADFVWASGASVLDRWGNPVYFAGAVADARARGARFAVASRRLSLTAAKADLWLPIRGSSAPIFEALSKSARGIAVDLPKVADSVGVPLERLEQLVKAVGEAQRPALIFGAEGGETVEDMVAGLALQKELGALPTAVDIGALVATDPLGGEEQEGAQRRTLKELEIGMKTGAVDIVVTVASDLLGAAPDSWGLADALMGEDAPLLVALASGRDATSEAARWVLPIQTDLECQQFSFPVYGRPGPEGLSMHVADPVIAARGAARHPLDVLLALGTAAEVDLRGMPLDMTSMRESVVGAAAELGAKSPKSVLRTALRGDGRLLVREGAYDLRPPIDRTLGREAALLPRAGAENQVEVGDRSEGQKFSLQLFEGVRGESLGWQRPWLAELPDPVSSAMWGSWVEMHPQDAVRLGLETGQPVQLTSVHGSLATTAFLHPATRPGTVTMPVGRFEATRGGDGDPRNLMGLAEVAGYPIHVVEVTLSVVMNEALDPAPIFGRGLLRAERIPAGWKSHEPLKKAESSHASLPIVEDPPRKNKMQPLRPTETQS